MRFADVFAGGMTVRDSGVLSGRSDSHTHILFGVDDGVKTPRDALAAIAYEERLGVSDVWCTPHVMDDYPNSTEDLQARFRQLCDLYSGPVKLHLAAEYMIDGLFVERLSAGDLLTFDDSVLLVETSVVAPPVGLEELLLAVMSEGYRPMLAHPERYSYMEMEDYLRLRDMGVLLQLNLGSLAGIYGNRVRHCAEALLKRKMYAACGSDCHSSRMLEVVVSGAKLSRDMLKALSGIGCDM